MLSSQWDNDNQHFVYIIVSWYLLEIITRQGFLFSCSCMNRCTCNNLAMTSPYWCPPSRLCLLLSESYFSCDAVYCSGGENCNEQHRQDLVCLYERITRAPRSADEITIPKSSKSNITPVPGWNELLEEPYNEARDAYLAWRSDNRPRSGPVHEWMKRTRARFKYAQKVAKRNEETYRADALAANFDTGNIKGFWKCNALRITIQGRLLSPIQCIMLPVPVKLLVCGNSILMNYSTLSLTSMKKLKYCPNVKKISIPMKFLLQLLKYMRPYRSCPGTRHLDMMAWCQNTFTLHHIEWK